MREAVCKSQKAEIVAAQQEHCKSKAHSDQLESYWTFPRFFLLCTSGKAIHACSVNPGRLVEPGAAEWNVQ
jgi:hypothetical protein